jgi:hypothetical protein
MVFTLAARLFCSGQVLRSTTPVVHRIELSSEVSMGGLRESCSEIQHEFIRFRLLMFADYSDSHWPTFIGEKA